MDVETRSMIYLSFLIGLSIILGVILVITGMNYKKALILSDLFVFVGAVYISFFY